LRIENLGIRRDGELLRAEAKVVWEDNDRPAQTVFFAVPKESAEYLCCNGDAFLVGCILPAAKEHEKRILTHEPACPRLKEGLATVFSLFRQWYDPQLKMPCLETTGTSKGVPYPEPRDTGSFLSGGIDSLAPILRRTAGLSGTVSSCTASTWVPPRIRPKHFVGRWLLSLRLHARPAPT